MEPFLFCHRMNQEKFNLTWHTYTDHLREMLHNLLFSEDLTDVTLVSEDKKRFKGSGQKKKQDIL